MNNTEIKYFIPSQLGILLDPMTFKTLFIIVNFKEKGAIINTKVIEKVFKMNPDFFDLSIQILFENNLIYFSNERIYPNMEKIFEYTHLKFQDINEMDLLKPKDTENLEITWKEKMKEESELSNLSLEDIQSKIKTLIQLYKSKKDTPVEKEFNDLPF